MRLNRLDLTRYGKFTDLSLSFPRPASGGPDLHLIFGANEAGKSTLLEAWLDLLFQIPVRSTMGFLHPYTTMQLGAALEIDERTHEIVRIKKRDNSLLGADGAPLGEALLHGGLRGLDRASYAAMFSLNGQTLDEGGESILASKGDLGELLFQASAGLTDLAVQLEELQAESETFLNRTGRKGVLRDLNADFEELGQQIKALDTAAAEYARLSSERDLAKATWEQARENAERAQASVLETERLTAAHPLLARLERLEAEIADMGDLPVPPEGWLAELPDLDRQETAIATRLEAAKNAVSGPEAELANLPPDQPVLNARDDIAAVEQLKSAYDTAVQDLPKRRSELDIAVGAVNECLSRLGQVGAEPATLLPEAAVVGRLRDLIEQSSGIETACRGAARELDDAKAEHDRALQNLRDAGGSLPDKSGLAGLVQTLRRDDPAGTCDRAKTHLDEAESRLQRALDALAPWDGTAGDLARLRAPDEAALAQLAARMQEADKLLERAKDRHDQLSQNAEQARTRHAASTATVTVTLEDAAEARTRRETEWSRHRAALTDETADAFEAAMRLDDQLTATLAQQRAEQEKTAGAARELAEAERQLEAARQTLGDMTTQRSDLSRQLGEIVKGVSEALPPDMDMPAFRTWLDRLDAARAALDTRNDAAREHERRAKALARALADIRAALHQAGHEIGETTGLTLALERAQSLLDRATRVEALRDAEAQARQDIARRTRDLETAEGARAQWQQGWAAACAETWMAEASFGVAEMRAILEELDRLRDHHGRMAELTHRITTMDTNRGAFEQAVQHLAARLDMDDRAPVPELWRHILQRLQAATSREERRAGLEQTLSNAQQSLAEIETAATLHKNRTAEFARYFGVSHWAETREALTRAGERAKLDATRRDLIGDLCELLHCETLAQVRERLHGIDADALAARAASLQSDLLALRRTQEEAQDAFRKADDAVSAVGGDDAVARLQEQRQILLLEMEEGAQRHLRQRLGLLAVDAALRGYRDTHRSGMLERASDAFRIMSRNRYSGLAAQPDGNREILVALGADGGSKQADQLSDGTRAQLYLALRIAGYHEFIRNNGPVPFIADDIMESFDDDRTTEAFGLMARMSEHGQVIYLTHHAHLCDIAARVCPSVHIHELPE